MSEERNTNQIVRKDARSCFVESPVSYTHLDVYKRQSKEPGSRQRADIGS